MSSIVYSMACISKTATGENTRNLGRFCFTTSKASCRQYGKPCAVKVARTVWKQGKCREASTYAYYYKKKKSLAGKCNSLLGNFQHLVSIVFSGGR